MNLNELFVDEFYKLFLNEDGKYVGSMEQARLTLQLKLNRFITLPYIRRAFDIFVGLNLINREKEKAYIEKQIGLKHFPKWKQKVYTRNLDVQVSDEVLKQIYLGFKDINEMTKETITKEDLIKLRNLEELKKIKIEEFELDNQYTYNVDFSDIELMYGVSRDTILEYIKILEEYNPESQCAVQEESNSSEELLRDEFRKQKIHELISNCISIIEKTLNVDGNIKVSLYQTVCYRSIFIGTMTIKNLEFKDNTLYIFDENTYMNFHICDLSIDKIGTIITLINNNVELKILINSSFGEELRKQYEVYYELTRCGYTKF